MKYDELLVSSRRRQTTMPRRHIGTESDSDYGRAIFSASFRRLQQKAQVFPLEDNAAVRSRLTHSLEVAYLGRLIALGAIDLFDEKQQFSAVGLDDRHVRRAFVNFVEVGCLVHDIGNPPFGHFGEYAIRNWFSTKAQEVFDRNLGSLSTETSGAKFRNEWMLDFTRFDGNPQGFRILTRLQWDRDEFGLNLTHAQLASFLKYTVAPHGIDQGSPYKKKAGYFSTEQGIVEEMWSKLKWDKGTRFPLVYIVEAADDIAYCLSDIEDGIEKGILDEKELLTVLRERGAGCAPMEDALKPASSGQARTFSDFKIDLTRTLVSAASAAYVGDHDKIHAGVSTPLLSVDAPCESALKRLKDLARERLFAHPDAQRPELAGYRIVFGLLEHLCPLLACSRLQFDAILRQERNSATDLERRLVRLLPVKHVKCYQQAVAVASKTYSNDQDMFEVAEWHHRAHLLVDYVSGMTDGFALKQYQLLSGIQI